MTSDANIQLLRTQPHYEELFLSIYNPTTIFSAQVSGAVVQGARTIPYNNSSGSYSDVFYNSVMLVGTATGLSDLGRVRVRSANGSSFLVAENWDIPWQNGLYLTVLNYIDLNPIYPRIISGTSSNGDPVIFYKDYDIAYTNQNSILGALPCMGSHQAVFLTSGTAQVYWSATGTNHVGGDSMTYAWTFEGGSPSTYSGITPGNVTYSTPGHYKTKLVITGSSGSVDTSFRFVSVYPRASNGDAIPPIQRWSTAQIQGSRSEAGYSVNLKIYDTINIYDGALVIIFADKTSYGNTQTTIGSPIKFVGYIQKGTIVYDYQSSNVEFTAVSVTSMMKDIEAFSISCNSVASPTTWYEIKNMNVSKVLYHYLKWHTTILDCTDVQYTGDARIVQYFDSNRESIYDAIYDFISKGILGEMVADRQGKIWVEISAGAVHNAPSVIPVNMPIIKNDWMGEPSIEENITRRYSALELGGVVFNGVDSSIAILAIAPGIAPGVRGNINRIEGFIATSQSQMNDVVGDYYAYLTARYAVSMKLVGNYNNIDIAPIQQCPLNISSSDTVRGITFANKSFHPIQMDWIYDAQNGSIYPSVKFALITNGLVGGTEAVASTPTGTSYSVPTGTSGQSITIPDIPPIDIPTIPPMTVPTLGLPSMPSIPIPNLNMGTIPPTWVIASPTAGTVPGPYIPYTKTLALIVASTNTGTVTFDLEVRVLPNVTGGRVNEPDITATSSGVKVIPNTNTVALAGEWLVLTITSTSGSPTEFAVSVVTQ